MKKIISIILLSTIVNVFGQKEVKIQIEDLSKPEKLLFSNPPDRIYKNLILKDVGLYPYEVEKDKIDFPYNILAKSEMPDSLVNFGYNSFFQGMFYAYAEHRPFVLSPDMVWLLINQGFAQHVKVNKESLRNKFVDFNGKKSLVVKSNTLKLNSPASEWEKIFPQFKEQIAKNTKGDLVDILSADFSTTTPVEKVATDITIMKSVEPYFEFIIIYMACGIPEVTLKGTPEDWQKVLDKTRQLAKYDLKWWTKELEPVLEEIVKTSKGDVDKVFWRNMFKYHSKKEYGAPKIVDGWIVKFFPYDKNGNRNNLKEISMKTKLPEEIVKVDLTYLKLKESGETEKIPLELWAGFMGLEQNKENFTLTPKIGWLVRKKDVDKEGLSKKFNLNKDYGISIRIDEVPKQILDLDRVERLELAFRDRIDIPDELAKVKITELVLSGKIDNTEIKRIKKLFPNTHLKINQKKIE